MKQDVSECGFMDAFKAIGRGDQFSHGALRALYEYLDNMEEDYTLDVIALCCEFAEYESVEEYNEAYDTEHATWDDVNEDTTALVLDDGEGAIIQQY